MVVGRWEDGSRRRPIDKETGRSVEWGCVGGMGVVEGGGCRGGDANTSLT